jgi:DNA-binding SARP family transcriptional activator
LRRDGRLVALAVGAERLLSFLALHSDPLQRTYVAGTLWPDTSERQAFANLRSCLWRLNRPGAGLVEAGGHRLGLAPGVRVDYRESAALTRTLVHAGTARHLTERECALLTRLLLPDWYEDWVLLERERHRQLCLLALESLAQRLARAEEYAAALDCALAAVTLEPLRESAHRIAVQIHLASGNASEAIRQYRLFRRVLRDRLGLEPSAQMSATIAGAYDGVAAHR